MSRSVVTGGRNWSPGAERTPLEADIDTFILLAGNVRQSDFRKAIGRHILRLPVGPGEGLLDHWRLQADVVGGRLPGGTLPMRVVLSADDDADDSVAIPGSSTMSIETDPNPTRGTGGLLRDLAESFEDDRRILVANANQVFFGDLATAVARLAHASNDVALMPAWDGNGGFLMLTRAACLRDVSDRGFVDLKEQALPVVASRFDVRVVEATPELTPTSIRSTRDYLEVLRRRAADGGSADTDRWVDRFRLIEEGAHIAPTALVQNSVVLAGGSVGAGAVVARCVVCSGASVADGEVLRDRVISPAGVSSLQ